MAQQGTTAQGATATTLPGYWPGAVMVVAGMIMVVAVRLHEFVPLVGLLKPVLLVGVGGAAILFARSSPAVRQSAVRHRLSQLMIAYFIWLALTVPFALWPAMAFNTWKGFLATALMMLGVFFCAPTRNSLDRLATSFVVLVLLYAIYAQSFGVVRGGRLGGLGGMYDSNDMASLMAIAFPMAAGMLTRSVPGRARVAAMLGVLALGLGVIASGSRGGVLAMLAGALVFGLGFRGGRGIAIVGALVVAGVVGWFTASPQFRARMNTLTSLEDDYNYTASTGRKAVWKRGRGYITAHPLWGVGAGNFPIAEGGALGDIGIPGKWSAAHNAYIQAFAELGLIGGGLFVAMLVLGARFALRMWRVPTSHFGRAPPLDRPEFLASLVAFASGAYFLSHAYFPPGFVIVALIGLADRVRAFEAAQGNAAVPRPVQAAPVLVRREGQRGGLAVRMQAPRPHGA